MTIYIRLEHKEAQGTKRNIFEIKEKINEINSKALDFERLRSEKRKRSYGLGTKIKEIREELEKIKLMLPKVETAMLKERILETLEIEKAKPKMAKMPTKKSMEKREKKKYQEELEELRKKIAALE